MKKFIFYAMLPTLFMHHLYAENMEEPCKESTTVMAVEKTRGRIFRELRGQNVTLTMKRCAGDTNFSSMVLTYHLDGKKIDMNLAIEANNGFVDDDCGCALYRGSIPEDADIHRFNVDLTIHTCQCHANNLWTAVVTEGYGWCGTMDSMMWLSGNPQ